MRPHANAAAVANRQAPVPQSGPTSSLAWHAQRVDEVLRTFATTTSGLSRGEAALRLDSYEAGLVERVDPFEELGIVSKDVVLLAAEHRGEDPEQRRQRPVEPIGDRLGLGEIPVLA